MSFRAARIAKEVARRTAESASGKDIQRAARAVLDWVWQRHELTDTSYWHKRFLPLEDIFAKARPARSMRLFRSERTDIDNNYRGRYTSWSLRDAAVHNFGWGERRLVTAMFRPEEVVVVLPWLSAKLDKDKMDEVIVRPGNYDARIQPFHWSTFKPLDKPFGD